MDRKDFVLEEYPTKAWTQAIGAVDALTRLIGMSREEFLGKAVRDYLSRCCSPSGGNLLEALKGRKRPYSSKHVRVLLTPAEVRAVKQFCKELKVTISGFVSSAAFVAVSLWIDLLSHKGAVILQLEKETIEALYRDYRNDRDSIVEPSNPRTVKEVRQALTKILNESKGKAIDWRWEGGDV